jgi:hypothetical protein
MTASPIFFFMNLDTRLTLHQLACARGLCEGRVRVHTFRPYTVHVYLCDFRKVKRSQAKKAGNTSMEDHNPY